MFFTSCKENLPKKNKKNKKPERIFTKVHIIYKSLGEPKIDLRSPIVEEYQDKKKIFPKGLFIIFYKKNKIISGYLKANWVQEIELENLYKAKNKVEIINIKKDTLQTNEILWNRKKKKIYTNTLTKIYYNNGIKIIAKNGLESSEDLNNIILKNTKGIIPFKE